MTLNNRGMACAQHEASLQALLFGELDEPERKALEHHLEVCARCRTAFEEAKVGLDALSSLREAPLPYGPDELGERSQPNAWAEFQSRLRIQEAVARHSQRPRRDLLPAWRAAAAAALLMAGFALGRSVGVEEPVRSPEAIGEAADALDENAVQAPRVEAEAVEALARAELLSDVGLRYVRSLQDLKDELARLSAGSSSPADFAVAREQARELIRDGRLLRRNLDPAKDRTFLATIGRAEIVLEELAVLEPDATVTSPSILRTEWRESEVLESLSTVDVEGKLALALEASGWIGKELLERKEF